MTPPTLHAPAVQVVADTVDVQVALFKVEGTQTESFGAGLHQAEGRLRAFLHDLAQLPGENQLALAGHAGGLDEQDVATDRRPCEPRGDTGGAGAQCHLGFVFACPEDLAHGVCVHVDFRRAALRDPHRDIAQYRADLPLEIAHAGLARVVGHDLDERIVSYGHLFLVEPVGAQLPVDQIAAADLQLFLLRIAGQLDDLHAITQRPGDRVEHVGSGDKKHLRQIKGHSQVVVPEASVLLRIEHLEQGR